MDFENIKSSMDKQASSASAPSDEARRRKSQMPIERIRKKMASEITAQLIIIVLFIGFPVIIPMSPLPKSVYIIFMTITCLITIGYLLRMRSFMKKSKAMVGSSLDVLRETLHELELTLAVYKTAIIAGSLLLPIAVAAIQMRDGDSALVFEKWFLLDITITQKALGVLVYLAIAAFIYFSTQWWADAMYGAEKRELEQTLENLTLHHEE